MMINNRGSFRLRKIMDISWSVPGQKIEGTGKIFNVSMTGMSFETDKLFEPEHGMSLSFNSTEIPPLPANGKLTWFRKAGEGQQHYQCGMRFPAESAFDPRWAQWMEESILKLAGAGETNILNRYLGGTEEE